MSRRRHLLLRQRHFGVGRFGLGDHPLRIQPAGHAQPLARVHQHAGAPEDFTRAFRKQRLLFGQT
ncbi:hypothetical protein D3C72_2263720 [compost metagenome]